MDSAPLPPQVRCLLLALPAELRLCIYEHVWDHHEHVEVYISTISRTMSITGKAESTRTGALLRTCKMICREAKSIMYGASDFSLCFHSLSRPSCEPLNLTFLRNVRMISLWIDLRCFKRRDDVRRLGREVEKVVRLLLENKDSVVEKVRITFPHEKVQDAVARPKTLLMAFAKLRDVACVSLMGPDESLQLDHKEYPGALKVLAKMKGRWMPTEEDLDAMKLDENA